MGRARKQVKPSPSTEYAGRTNWECVLTIPELREMRVRLMIGHFVDPDRVVHVVETLENILTVASKRQAPSRHGTRKDNLAAEEVVEVIDTLGAVRATLLEEDEERVEAFETQVADLETAQKAAREDYATDIRAHCVIIDELRARAKKAEHEAEQLSRMNELLRSEKPLKARG